MREALGALGPHVDVMIVLGLGGWGVGWVEMRRRGGGGLWLCFQQ